MHVPIAFRMRVGEVMTRRVVTIPSTATAQEASELMDRENIGSLVVVEEARPVGIITERDLVRKVLARRRDPKEVKVSEIMSRPLIYVTPDAFLSEAAGLMGRHNIRRLPVIEGDRLVGIITMYDVIRHYRETIYSIIDMLSTLAKV